MDIFKTLEKEFKINPVFLKNTITLIDEDNTIPFIARYRKEMTGSLDDQTLRELYERLMYLRGMDEKRKQYENAISEQGKLTDEISAALENAATLAELEDIYRPFRPKRRTRATIAREKGLGPLAAIIFGQELTKSAFEIAAEYIDAEKGVNTAEEAVAGAMDIIAEDISDNADYRSFIKEMTFERGNIISKAADEKEETVYTMYYDFKEPVKSIAGHRILAVNRGESEGKLKAEIEAPDGQIIDKLNALINKNNIFTKDLIKNVIDDSYERLIKPSVEREIRNALTERGEDGAIKVFAENLKQLLLQPPLKNKTALALDPGYRTGCKTAVMDGTGKVLATGIIYPTHSEKMKEEAARFVKDAIKKFGVDIIAIGNGTASRETEQFTADVINNIDAASRPKYAIVNEAGASVYSASKLAANEFPDFDVALRSAVSIGRRLQDPLAELVKIDPKSIGVGQYQHDMNQKRLSETLSGVVEDCVNAVGVDVNTASPQLLSYVAGISAAVAKNILLHREQNGRFKSRAELNSVKSLGPKTFEQCAGFLRIPGGQNPLDNTGVHPESYDAAKKLLETIGMTVADVGKKDRAVSVLAKNRQELARELKIGTPTLADIIKELDAPGRDPRDDAPAPILRGDILEMKDLQPGMTLKGTVRNIMDFGAFVDIGVHQDGLVHISQMSDKYIKHPLEAASVGDIVDVTVLSVDLAKKRIALSMKKEKKGEK